MRACRGQDGETVDSRSKTSVATPPVCGAFFVFPLPDSGQNFALRRHAMGGRGAGKKPQAGRDLVNVANEAFLMILLSCQ